MLKTVHGAKKLSNGSIHTRYNRTRGLVKTSNICPSFNSICASSPRRNIIAERNEGPLWKSWAVTVDLIIIVSPDQLRPAHSNSTQLPSVIFSQSFPLSTPLFLFLFSAPFENISTEYLSFHRRQT